MSRLKQLIHEVHRRSLWQVLGIYVVGGWIMLQVVDTLAGALNLPEWASPLALFLLIIGLPIVLATAFVQEGVGRRDPVEVETTSGGTPIPSTAVDEGPPHRLFTWRNAILGGMAAFALWGIIAAAWVLLGLRGPDEAIAAAADPGVAVLPFEVKGEGLDVWREGMVDLLATNLDGAGGLRAIDSRTVLARWREGVGDGETPDLATALEVARRAEARFAIVGSAVALGADVRLVADVYRVSDGEKLGQAQVEGSPDSVLALVDRLSIEILQVVLPEYSQTATPVNLAGATTTSVVALRAYLEGERLFRESDFPGAIGAFERAIAEDSTFALALYRLSNAYGWYQSIQAPLTLEYRARAIGYSDRLPERARDVVQGMMALVEGDVSQLGALEALVRRYPDDVDAWMTLGEMQYHLGAEAALDVEGGRRAFRRALALDPNFTPAYIHLIDMALERADSAEVAELVEAYHEVAPGTAQDVEIRTAVRLAFGDTIARTEAWADVAEAGWDGMLPRRLDHPRFWAQRDALLDRFGSEGGTAFFFSAEQRIRMGRLRDAASTMDDARHFPDVPQLVAYRAWQRGLDLSQETVDRYLSASSTTDAPSAGRDFYLGAAAILDGHFATADTIIVRLEARADSLGSEDDAHGQRTSDGVARALRGYALSKRGQPEAALPVLDSARLMVTGFTWEPYANRDLRLWTAKALIELGRLEDAERYLLSILPHREPLPAYELGKLYVARDEPDKARPYLLFVLDAWDGADPELQPKVEELQTLIEAMMPDQ